MAIGFWLSKGGSHDGPAKLYFILVQGVLVSRFYRVLSPGYNASPLLAFKDGLCINTIFVPYENCPADVDSFSCAGGQLVDEEPITS